MTKNISLIDAYQEEYYHWNNQEKKYLDHVYLQSFKDKIIKLLKIELNRLHGTKYSVRSWDIMVGYWLIQFLTVTYDRLVILKSKKYKLKKNKESSKKFETSKIPLNSIEARSFFFDHEWNELFFKQLQYEVNGISTSIVQIPVREINKLRYKDKIKNTILRIINYFLSLNDKNIDYVISSSGLTNYNLFKFLFNLPGKSLLEPQFPLSNYCIYESEKRKWNLIIEEKDTDFERIVKKLIPLWMPLNFVENFNYLLNKISNQNNLPNYSKVIFSTNNHFINDSFKIWTAKQIDQGSKLVIGQHGGGPFQKFNAAIKYEIDISDMYITPGNGNKGNKKYRDVGQYFAKLEENHWDAKGVALIVSNIFPMYVFELRSMASANNMNSYLNDQFIFYKNLPNDIKEKTIVRLPIVSNKDDYGWKIKDRWIKKFNQIKIENQSISLKESVKKCRVLIHTTNSTTYNESLAANIPTIVFWDENYWKFEDYVNFDISLLKSVGIFHETPDSAAKHLKKIWNTVSEWWLSNDVQKIRIDYCRKYAYRHKGIEKKLNKVLLEAAKI